MNLESVVFREFSGESAGARSISVAESREFTACHPPLLFYSWVVHLLTACHPSQPVLFLGGASADGLPPSQLVLFLGGTSADRQPRSLLALFEGEHLQRLPLKTLETSCYLYGILRAH